MSESASFESQEEAVMSLQDVLDEERQAEETANALLGASDSKNCTYDKVT